MPTASTRLSTVTAPAGGVGWTEVGVAPAVRVHQAPLSGSVTTTSAVDGDGRVGARQTFQCLQAAGVEVAQPAAGQGDQSCGGDLGTPG